MIIGFRLSPFRLFFCPFVEFEFAANAAVVATFLAWLVTAFLISLPFIIANEAAYAAIPVPWRLSGLAGPGSGLEGERGMLGVNQDGALQLNRSGCAMTAEVGVGLGYDGWKVGGAGSCQRQRGLVDKRVNSI